MYYLLKKLENILDWLFDLTIKVKLRVYKVRGLLKEEFEAGEFIVDLDEPVFDIIELARPLKKDDKRVYYTNYWDYDTGVPRYDDWNGGSVSKITPLIGKVGKYYYSYRLATQKEIDRLKDPEGNKYDPNNKWKYDKREQIRLKAGELADFGIAHGAHHQDEYYEGFKDGAKWADSNPPEKPTLA